MKVKKILFVICMCLIILVFSGCKKNEENTKKNEVNQEITNQSVDNENEKEIDISKVDFVEEAKKQLEAPKQGDIVAIMHIKNYGEIKIKLFKDEAPKAVTNFMSLAKKGYYNNVTFHRVINDFMIQGGDPTATGRGGESIWGKPFEDEFAYNLLPYRGALCMANSGSNTNGSQFFIEQANYNEKTSSMLKQGNYPENILKAYKEYGGSMHLYCKHTVFGQVYEGMDIVDKIAATATDENDKPLEDVIIEKIDIIE